MNAAHDHTASLKNFTVDPPRLTLVMHRWFLHSRLGFPLVDWDEPRRGELVVPRPDNVLSLDRRRHRRLGNRLQAAEPHGLPTTGLKTLTAIFKRIVATVVRGSPSICVRLLRCHHLRTSRERFLLLCQLLDHFSKVDDLPGLDTLWR